MLKYWRQTLDGLIGLTCDALEVPIVLAGEWALKRWDKQHPNAHDIDMGTMGADLLAEAEADQDVWEPLEPPSLYAVMGQLVYAAEIIAEAAEAIEQYVNHQEKQS